MIGRMVLALGFMLGAGMAQAGCAGVEAPCETAGGTYHIALPEGAGPFPVLVFLHGYGGSGEGTMRQFAGLAARGYAVIGPDGLPRPGDTRRRWSFHPLREAKRNEAAFLRGVIADAAERFRMDPSRVLLAGFSIGGSMVSYLACSDPDIAAAYAPVAGSFWRPHPALDACKGPVRLLHTHGWRDGTVPLEGRPLRGGEIEQGDVFYAMQVWRETNGCDGMKATEFSTGERFWRRRWTECKAGALELVLHPGGHGTPVGWADIALDWFEGLPAE